MNIITWHDFGTTLRQARETQDLSQEQLAERISCHRTYIWKLEHGKSMPSTKFLHSLAYACPALRSDLTLFTMYESMAAYRLADNTLLQHRIAHKVTSTIAR